MISTSIVGVYRPGDKPKSEVIGSHRLVNPEPPESHGGTVALFLAAGPALGTTRAVGAKTKRAPVASTSLVRDEFVGGVATDAIAVLVKPEHDADRLSIGLMGATVDVFLPTAHGLNSSDVGASLRNVGSQERRTHRLAHRSLIAAPGRSGEARDLPVLLAIGGGVLLRSDRGLLVVDELLSHGDSLVQYEVSLKGCGVSNMK